MKEGSVGLSAFRFRGEGPLSRECLPQAGLPSEWRFRVVPRKMLALYLEEIGLPEAVAPQLLYTARAV